MRAAKCATGLIGPKQLSRGFETPEAYPAKRAEQIRGLSRTNAQENTGAGRAYKRPPRLAGLKSIEARLSDASMLRPAEHLAYRLAPWPDCSGVFTNAVRISNRHAGAARQSDQGSVGDSDRGSIDLIIDGVGSDRSGQIRFSVLNRGNTEAGDHAAQRNGSDLAPRSWGKGESSQDVKTACFRFHRRIKTGASSRTPKSAVPVAELLPTLALRRMGSPGGLSNLCGGESKLFDQGVGRTTLTELIAQVDEADRDREQLGDGHGDHAP